MKINGIELTGKVTEVSKKYDSHYEWWECSFKIEGCHLIDIPLECYTRLSKTEPMIEDGQEILIEGHLCGHDSEVCGRYFNVMVNRFVVIDNGWQEE